MMAKMDEVRGATAETQNSQPGNSSPATAIRGLRRSQTVYEKRPRFRVFDEREQDVLLGFVDRSVAFRRRSGAWIRWRPRRTRCARAVGFRREDVENSAANGEFADHLDGVARFVADGAEVGDDVFERDFLAGRRMRRQASRKSRGVRGEQGRGDGRDEDREPSGSRAAIIRQRAAARSRCAARGSAPAARQARGSPGRPMPPTLVPTRLKNVPTSSERFPPACCRRR